MSTVRKNIAFLYALQGVGYIVPLVTLPYLSRVLGVEHFGVFGIALAVVSVMSLITDWGFSVTAMQQVARHANDPETLRRILWDTHWARLGLGAVSFLGLGIVMAVAPSIGGLGVVVLAAAVQVLASMLSVGWFLQGLERMGALVTASIAGRVLSIPLLVLFVHKPSDVALATLIPGLCNFIPAAVSLYWAGRFVPLFPVRFDVLGMWRELCAGAQLFLTISAVNLYTQSTVLILSALSATSEVGLYHGADRIRRAVQTLIGPVGIALFPRINNLLQRDRAAARQLMWRLLIGQGGATFVLSVVMYVSAPWGVPLVLGQTFSAAVPVVQWLAPIPFLVGLNSALALNVMLPLGMKSEVTAIVTASAAINLVAMVILCPTHGAIGAAISATLTETFVTAAMGVVVLRRSGYRWGHIRSAAVRRLWTRGRAG
jgi:PST family polysaccharide transporter